MPEAHRKSRAKTADRHGRPITVNGTVPPRLVPYSKRRQREYLTVKEVGLLMDTARERGRYGHRDATMILVAFRHGLRAGELCSLRWDQVDFGRGLLHVRRIKNGTPSVHPMGGVEIRVLRRLKREQPESRYVFVSERLAPMTTAGLRKTMARIGERARFLGFEKEAAYAVATVPRLEAASGIKAKWISQSPTTQLPEAISTNRVVLTPHELPIAA